MYRDIIHGDEARRKLLAGIDSIAETVKYTMGVRGKSVALDTNPYTNPTYTNDGVSIAQELIIEDRFENVGAKLIREIAAKTNDNAGDGTTTAMVLMQAIVHEGMRMLASNADGILLRKGIRKAAKNIVDYLETEKVTADSPEVLASVATVSCRDEELGKMIADVVTKAGKDGMIHLEDSFEDTTEYEQLEGLRLRGGLIHDVFINEPESKKGSFNDVPVIVTNQSLAAAGEMVAIMQQLENAGHKKAVLIAANVEGDALATAAINWQKNTMQVMPIRVLAYGDLGEGMLKDVAAITGATYIDGLAGNRILDFTIDKAGFAAKVVASKHDTTVISDDEDLKEARIADIKAAKEDAQAFEKENLEERIAKLSSAMFTIKVGAVTETERKELKTRLEDAINATRAAANEGIIPGGGSTLYRAAKAQKTPDILTDEGMGENIVYKACARPIAQMAENSGFVLGKHEYEQVSKKGTTFDFADGKLVDAVKNGIVDPIKVTTEAITNAASGAGTFLTTNSVIVLQEQKAQQAEQI